MIFGTPQSSAAAQGATRVVNFDCVTGTQTYTTASTTTDLIGATILNVFYGGQRLQTSVAPADYTFNAATGAITFVIVVNTGVEASIEYQLAV